MPREDGRENNQLRTISLESGIAPHATASILVAFGNTRVICAASLEAKVPRWMQAQDKSGGWITAEYSMLPYSTLDRKPRDATRGKQDGRSIEIQRLIGRSIRAVADLAKLPGHTLWLDCDVLQADGGTRTASITGAWVAAELAVRQLINAGKLEESPFVDSVAAVSCGIVEGEARLDLPYVEDRDASVDANFVMTGTGKLVEVQASGEEATFEEEEFDALRQLAKDGIAELTSKQQAVLAG